MNKEVSISSRGGGEIDLSLWRDFQKGLTALLDIPIALYDGRANVVVPPQKDMPVCRAVCQSAKGRELCRETYVRAVAQVLEKKKIYIYKCHANEYIFAIPVFLDNGSPYVIIGGHVYLEGSEVKEFIDGMQPYSFDAATLDMLRRGVKTIPPRSIFTIPGIVSNMAVPFLRSLHIGSRRASETDAGRARMRDWMRYFHALDQVYRTIAPVLDREELYETILVKSTELLNAERGSLMILDNKNNVLSVKASRGIDRSILGEIKVKVGEGISGAIAAKGAPVMVRNIEDEVPSRKNMPWYKTKSFISIPLKLEDRIIGVLNISDKVSGEVFSEEDMLLLLSFANYASIALERGAYYSMSEELKMISMTDPLTGLFNRRYFRERLFEEVERVKRHGESFSAFIVDIDNFKIFNDRYGHLAGDEMLRKVSHTIRDAVRSMDVVARYGGEEFAVILPHTTKRDSQATAERIRKGVEDIGAALRARGRESPTISIGVAEFPGDAATIEELINNADRAMYTAKRQGKNRVVLYER